MSNFMCSDISERASRKLIIKYSCPDLFVNGCRLYKTPVMKQLNTVEVKQNIALYYFAGPGVGTTWSHRVFNVSGDHSVAIVSNIIRVKFRVVGGIVLYLYHILVTNLLKGLVPFKHTFFNIWAPFAWDCGVNVEYNRLNNLGQFAAMIG